MQVHVTGKHVDVGEALRTRVADELSSSIAKYFDRAGGSADVVVSREGSAFKVDCAVALASGQQLTTHGLGGDAHLAFDSAMEKMAKRIRRYKNRLKSHHSAALAKQAESAAYFVIAAVEGDDADEALDDGGGHVFPEPMIIAETEKVVRSMTVSMAVMELDLTEAQTIVFRNAAHGGLSVVYRRPDGNIGWIDPERTRGRIGTEGEGAGPAH
ncbi:ribosome-associated translation inhibitor RaiA [Phenylobacterium sp.]|uniref:ribosome hibernation-promoting factor, HPF/YfiA family n=1 Tax=Phenylobacterium sp. TaxID=1871053 RepID=UPI0025E370E6|nr:ribosome-associated translation inhibitor RaiA [Phenylobacterium sp.]